MRARSSLALVFFFAALVWARSVAAATPWTASFDEGRAASYLAACPTHAPGLLVVAAGNGPGVAAATSALKAAFVGHARVVLGGDALGPVAELDDAAIVRRAEQVPVDVVVVVRVFAGEHGRDTAVVTLYPKKGAALTAFSVEVGAALPAYAPEPAGGGISPRVVSAVLGNRDAPDDRSPARQRYDDRFIGFYETQPLARGADSFDRACPYRGAARTPLCGPTFYDAVDRPDLALASRHRVTARRALIASGVVALVVGTAVSLGGGFAGFSGTCVYSSCERGDPNYPVLGTGLGLLGYGIVGVAVGSTLRKQPVEPAAMYRLARAHNRALRNEVGLTEDVPDTVPRP